MSKVVSTVQLFSLRVDNKGDIRLSCTRAFFETVRSKLGALKGSSLRLGTFDFMEVCKNTFVGVPDERGSDSAFEGKQIANRVLMTYRASVLFEKVFAEKNSYENFVLFNRRGPTVQDMKDIGVRKGIVVPFMAIPYKANLSGEPVAVVAVLTQMLASKRTVSIKIAAGTPGHRSLSVVKPSPTVQQLNALTERFSRSSARV